MTRELEALIERLEKAGETHAKMFVSKNVSVSGRPVDIRLAADCFAVAAALRARSTTAQGEK